MPVPRYVNTDYKTTTRPVNVPDPVNPQDASTRHFLLTQAATLAAMPAPVTSGSGIQTFTDVLSDVWIAANGVNSGAWKRARDVLHSRVYINTATNITTTAALLTFGSVSRDPYALYNVSTGVFTAPVTALYVATVCIKYTTAAPGDYVTVNFQVNGTTVSTRTDVTAIKPPTPPQSAFLTDRCYMNAGDTFRIVAQANNTFAVTTGATNSFLDIDFFGQG